MNDIKEPEALGFLDISIERRCMRSMLSGLRERRRASSA